MARRNNLPFERGATYFNGDSALVSASLGVQLEGQTFDVDDETGDTNRYLRLRIIRNSSGGRLGTPATIARGVKMSTAATYFGRRTTGYVATKGGFGMLIDPYYTTSIASNDLFYVVEQGPALCGASTLTSGAHTMTAGALVAFTTGGRLVASAAGFYDLGRLGEAITAAITGARKTVIEIGSVFADGE